MANLFKDEIRSILKNTVPTPSIENHLSDEEKIEKITGHFHEIMNTLGLDLSHESITDTPHRIAKLYVNDFFSGLNPENFPNISVIDNDMNYDQMIVVKNIEIMSTCEHHFVTIDGRATIAYIPGKKVIGLSKINRIAHFFSRRPQVQERLTKQIADCLQQVLETEDIAVHIDAKHYCVVSRGARDTNSMTSTCDIRGEFMNSPETRSEFMSNCKY